jgi:hypothetical protein
MSEKEKEKIDVLIQKVDEIKIEVDTIKRGIYGDQKNKVSGLIDRQDLDERRISAIEGNQKRFFAVLGMIGVAVQVALNLVWDYVKGMFK